MATIRQMEANRQNAQKSTGPKTPEGKAASSQNRLSNGFSSNMTVIPGEDPDEFNALLHDFAVEYQPAVVTEQVLVEQMAANHWLTLRALRLQGEAFIDEALTVPGFSIPKSLGLLIRYQTTAERAFHRAHNDLVKTQKERKKSEIGFKPQDAREPAIQTAAERQKEPQIIPITWCDPDFPPETLTTDIEILPQALESIKNVA